MALEWTTDEYEEALNDPFSQYVQAPTVGWGDTFFGIPTDSWYKKMTEYVNKIKQLHWEEDQRTRARDETWMREDSQYQRLVEDMKKAGLNPYWLLANGTGSPVSSSSQQASYGSTSMYDGQSKSKGASLLKTLGVLIAFLKFLA